VSESEIEMKYLDLHGDRVAYREAGAGEALLLIHGMGGKFGDLASGAAPVVEEIPGGGARPVRAR